MKEIELLISKLPYSDHLYDIAEDILKVNFQISNFRIVIFKIAISQIRRHSKPSIARRSSARRTNPRSQLSRQSLITNPKFSEIVYHQITNYFERRVQKNENSKLIYIKYWAIYHGFTVTVTWIGNYRGRNCF